MRISLEEFSAAVRAIHAAAGSPALWPDAHTAVARLVDDPAVAGRRERNGRRVRSPAYSGPERRRHQESEPSVQRLRELLEAHIESARELQGRLAEAALGRLALASLDTLTAAAFVLDKLGRVYLCNDTARDFAKDVFGVQLVNSKFRLRDVKLNSAIQLALRRATQEPACMSIFPLRCSHETVCELAIAPLSRDRSRPVSESLALLVIARPHHDENHIVERVKMLYGLTRAEARVMAALAVGTIVEEIAEKHGVRPSTVRAQVRSIFDKTGAKRQSDLVRLALSGVPLVSSLDC